ncbi:MAG TPA: hypothetical protein VN256_05475 [Pyrinomonadaceae bacterium]|nr:hypothetical protein [Pyrinomonadaceae bacterium]
MSYTALLDTHNVIVTAIRNDFAGVASVTVGDCTLADVDDHDPLGLAFYTYAILETGYTNQELAFLPDTWRYWVEEKVNYGRVSSYTDRDLAALGLAIFALCQHRTCPEVNGRFGRMVEKFFSPDRGLFDNFLATVLVALGLSKLPAEDDLYRQFVRCIDAQLKNHADAIFNDAKNLVVAYMWAKHTQAEDLRPKLRQACLQKASGDDCLPRDLVYVTYILFEEIEKLSRDERALVRTWVKDSLRFIRTYSVEAGFPSEVLEEFGGDVALATPDIMRQYGYPVRPRLSRILLSVGHMMEQRFVLNPHLLQTDEQRKKAWLRGIAYPLLLLLGAAAVAYVGRNVGFPFDVKAGFATKQFLPILLATFEMLANTAWMTVFIMLIVMASVMFYRILITAQDVDDYEAIKNALKQARRLLWIEIGLAVLGAIIEPLVQ